MTRSLLLLAIIVAVLVAYAAGEHGGAQSEASHTGSGVRSETRGSASAVAPDLASASTRSGGDVSEAPPNRAAAASHSMPAAGLEGSPPPATPTPPLAARTVLRGSAAWCAPTATRCRGWGGHVLLGAVRSFRWGDAPYRVRVVHGSRSVIVTVVSFCACGGNRVIDLSPWAFAKLAPLSAGLVRVRVLQ